MQKRVKVRGRVSVRHTEGDEDHAECEEQYEPDEEDL